MSHVRQRVLCSDREINGLVYSGDVKEKEKAKKQYEKAVSSGKTAALVKYVARKHISGHAMAMVPLFH